MKAIALDNSPDKYLCHLENPLRGYSIDLDVKNEISEFHDALLQADDWDFAVVALFESAQALKGLDILPLIKDLDIAFLVPYMQNWDRGPNPYENGLPKNIKVVPKGNNPWTTSRVIYDELRERCLFYRRQDVYIICSRRDVTHASTRYVEEWLTEELGLRPHGIGLTGTKSENTEFWQSHERRQCMAECAAYIAIYPQSYEDQPRAPWQPYWDVFGELTSILSLPRILSRSVILKQHLDDEDYRQPDIIEQLKGVPKLSYVENVTHTFHELEKSLRRARVGIDRR